MTDARRVIAVAGSRGYSRPDFVKGTVRGIVGRYGTDSAALASGGCRNSPDVWAEEVARAEGVHFIRIDALWDARGNRAGFDRNHWLERVSDSLLAFWDGASAGTRHTIELFRIAGKPVLVYGNDGNRIPNTRLPGPASLGWRLLPQSESGARLFYAWRDCEAPWNELAGFVQNHGPIDTDAFRAEARRLGFHKAPASVRNRYMATLRFFAQLPTTPGPTDG